MTRLEALVRFDEELREAAEKLLPFGPEWVDKLGEAFFALNEDRKYLPNTARAWSLPYRAAGSCCMRVAPT